MHARLPPPLTRLLLATALLGLSPHLPPSPPSLPLDLTACPPRGGGSLLRLPQVSVTPRDKLKLLTTGFHARSLATVIQAIDVRKADCFNARDKEFILGAIHDEHKNLDRFADLIQSALGRQLAEKVQPTLEATSLQKVNAEVRPKAVQEALACRFDSAAKALARELMSAAEDGNLSRVQSLLNRGAPVDGSPDDGEGGRALWQAAYEGHSAVVRLLLEHGADPNLTRTKDMTSPLTVACFNVRALPGATRCAHSLSPEQQHRSPLPASRAAAPSH